MSLCKIYQKDYEQILVKFLDRLGVAQVLRR